MMYFNQIKQYKNTLLAQKVLIFAYFIFIILVLTLNALYSNKIAQLYEVEFTIADVMILSTWYNFFPISIVVFTTLIMSILMKNDFRTMIILRQKSKQAMWLTQVKKITFISFVFTLFLIVIAFILGLIMCKKNINFTQDSSLFRVFTKVTMNHEINIVAVILMCFITAFLSITLMSLIVILSKWIFNNYLVGILIVTSICWIDSNKFVGGFKVFFNTNSAFYHQWFDESQMLIHLIYPVIYIIVVIGIGLYVSKGKDFLNVKQ